MLQVPNLVKSDLVFNERLTEFSVDIYTSRQEEIRKRKDNEIRLTKELANKAEDYRIASEIRTYIKAMIENENEEATPEWIEWASRKADWYDPTKDVEDEYLGKREHGKNKEEKDIDKVSVKRGWYW